MRLERTKTRGNNEGGHRCRPKAQITGDRGIPRNRSRRGDKPSSRSILSPVRRNQWRHHRPLREFNQPKFNQSNNKSLSQRFEREHLECRLEANRNTTKYRVNNRLSSNERFFQKIFEQYLQKKRKRGKERGCKEESDIEKEGSKTGGIRKFTIPPPPSSIIFDSANGHTMGALRTRYSVHGSLRVFRAHPLALRMIHAVVIQRGGGGGWLRLNEEIMTNLAATSLLHPPPLPSRCNYRGMEEVFDLVLKLRGSFDSLGKTLKLHIGRNSFSRELGFINIYIYIAFSIDFESF